MQMQARRSNTTSNGRYYRALRPTVFRSGHAERGGSANRSCHVGGAGENEPLKQLAALGGTYRGFTALSPAFFSNPHGAFLARRRALTQMELHIGNGIWRVDMMKCPYHDTAWHTDVLELCCCFCDSDDDISYTFGLHPKPRHRTKRWGAAILLRLLHEDCEINAQE